MSKAKKKTACVISSGVPDISSIKVTAEDIRLGKQGMGESCAIARAVKRTLGIKNGVSVTGSTFEVSVPVKLPPVQVCIGGKLVTVEEARDREATLYFDLGYAASDFIGDFDDDKKSVKPTTFKNSGTVEFQDTF